MKFELTEKQIIKLIEENLDNKFKYYLDNMMDEKRPFGNSGFPSIVKDIIEVADTKKKWNVSSEDELDDLMFEYGKGCFLEIKEWIKENGDNFKVKIVALEKEGEHGN